MVAAEWQRARAALGMQAKGAHEAELQAAAIPADGRGGKRMQ
jgi:hypothetical protein